MSIKNDNFKALVNNAKKNISSWNPLKWFFSICWLFTGIFLIIDIVLLVLYSNSKDVVQTNALSACCFIMVCLLTFSIFSQVIDVYRKKKK